MLRCTMYTAGVCIVNLFSTKVQHAQRLLLTLKPKQI